VSVCPQQGIDEKISAHQLFGLCRNLLDGVLGLGPVCPLKIKKIKMSYSLSCFCVSQVPPKESIKWDLDYHRGHWKELSIRLPPAQQNRRYCPTCSQHHKFTSN